MKNISTFLILSALIPTYALAQETQVHDQAVVNAMKPLLSAYREILHKKQIMDTAEECAKFKKDQIENMQEEKPYLARLVALLHNQNSSTEELSTALGALNGYHLALELVKSKTIKKPVIQKRAEFAFLKSTFQLGVETIQEAQSFLQGKTYSEEVFDASFAKLLDDFASDVDTLSTNSSNHLKKFTDHLA